VRILKISNGYISATHHPIHFVFGSMVGLLGAADQTILFPVGSNPRRRLVAIVKNSNGHISATHYPMCFMYVQTTDHTLLALRHYDD